VGTPSNTVETYGHLGLLNMVKTYDLLIPRQEDGGQRSVYLTPKSDVPMEDGAPPNA